MVLTGSWGLCISYCLSDGVRERQIKRPPYGQWTVGQVGERSAFCFLVRGKRKKILLYQSENLLSLFVQMIDKNNAIAKARELHSPDRPLGQ
jgi:hypothetical protein